METTIWLAVFWGLGLIAHVSWLSLYFTANIRIDIAEWIVAKFDSNRLDEFETSVMTREDLNDFLAEKYGRVGYLLGCPQCLGTYLNILTAAGTAGLLWLTTPVSFGLAVAFFLFAFPTWNHLALKLELDLSGGST